MSEKAIEANIRLDLEELSSDLTPPIDDFTEEEVVITSDTGTDISVRRKSFTWGKYNLHGMHTIKSTLNIYSTGLVETRCEMENKSRHRKYGNRVQFKIHYRGGRTKTLIAVWSGNFTNGDQKVYTDARQSTTVENLFEQIGSNKAEIFRHWEVWKRN